MSNITQQDKRLAEIESTEITSAEEIAARTRLSAALRRVGTPDGWVPPKSKTVIAPTTIEDILRAGRSRIAQDAPTAQIATPAPVAPPTPAEALTALPGDAEVDSEPAPVAPLDRAALFAAFAKSAGGSLQTVDILNFNAAFAAAKVTGTFVPPSLTPVKRADEVPISAPGSRYDPYDLA